MEFLKPKNCICDEKAYHFSFFKIKVKRTPLFILPVFVNCPTIKFTQSMGVFTKVSWYPVKNNAYPCKVELINKIHEIFRSAKSARAGIITSHLISPRTIKRMFHNGHQFKMGISHLKHIF